MTEVKIKAIGNFAGISFKQNGGTELKFKFNYGELVNYYAQLPLLRSVDTTIVIKIGDAAAIKLGTFMLKSYNFDHDGEGQITVSSQIDYVELDNISTMLLNNKADFKVMLRAEIDLEDET